MPKNEETFDFLIFQIVPVDIISSSLLSDELLPLRQKKEKLQTLIKTGSQKPKASKHNKNKVEADEWESEKDTTIKRTISIPFCFICRIELIEKSTGLGPSLKAAGRCV